MWNLLVTYAIFNNRAFLFADGACYRHFVLVYQGFLRRRVPACDAAKNNSFGKIAAALIDELKHR